MPLVYLMGVRWKDCRPIGEVIGLKTFINEMVAYERLDEMMSSGLVKSVRKEINLPFLCLLLRDREIF